MMSAHPPSECLPERNIDLERIIHILAAIKRRGDVETHRADRRVIAKAKPRTPEQRVAERRREIGESLTAINKGDRTDGLAETVAYFGACLEHRAPAFRVAAHIKRPGHLIAIATHGAAAPCI